METARCHLHVLPAGLVLEFDFIFTWRFTYYNETEKGNLQLPAYQKRSTVSVINMEDNNLK